MPKTLEQFTEQDVKSLCERYGAVLRSDGLVTCADRSIFAVDPNDWNKSFLVARRTFREGREPLRDLQ